MRETKLPGKEVRQNSKMATPKKQETVRELSEMLAASKSVILTDFRGLSMKDFNELRSRLRPEQVTFRVVKNTLLRRAAEGTPLAELVENLEGPTAVAFGLGDSVAPARLLADFIKETRSPLTIRSGVVEGKPCSAEAVTQIAKLPPREQMIAQVLGGLQAPLANLAGTLQQLIGSVVWTLQGVAEKKAAA